MKKTKCAKIESPKIQEMLLNKGIPALKVEVETYPNNNKWYTVHIANALQSKYSNAICEALNPLYGYQIVTKGV